MKPKDLHLAPSELFPSEGCESFLEWSVLRNWVSQWLKYCRWYYMVALSPDVNLEAFFDAPQVETSFQVKMNYRDDLCRFGLMWKCFDFVSEKGPSWCPPSLVEYLPNYVGYMALLGG